MILRKLCTFIASSLFILSSHTAFSMESNKAEKDAVQSFASDIDAFLEQNNVGSGEEMLAAYVSLYLYLDDAMYFAQTQSKLSEKSGWINPLSRKRPFLDSFTLLRDAVIRELSKKRSSFESESKVHKNDALQTLNIVNRCQIIENPLDTLNTIYPYIFAYIKQLDRISNPFASKDKWLSFKKIAIVKVKDNEKFLLDWTLSLEKRMGK